MATDPNVALARLAASVAVPNGPIQEPPRLLGGDASNTDNLRHLLLTELAGVDLGAWDVAVVGWTARVGEEYVLTLASLIRRAYHAGLDHGGDHVEHQRDGSCCGLPAGDV